MIEETLARHGMIPDIEDERFGEAYDTCPAIQKSLIKNAISFAYALAQTGMEPVVETRRVGHLEQTVCQERLDWAFFSVDLRRFPVTAVFSAIVQALVARIESLVVHVSGPVTETFLVGCDLLSVHQVFTGSADAILDVLRSEGQGICIDLAGQGLDFPRIVRPDPAGYGVAVHLPDSEYVHAYNIVTAETSAQSRPYLSYGGAAGSAPVVMAGNLLGCWLWDCISPSTFRITTHTFS